MPKFSILNPRYTLTLPHYQMISGIYDILIISVSSTSPEKMIIRAIISVKD